jgi:tRNA (guanine9-N1)-methyltransferase
LTSDAEETLETLDDNTAYIIGGIVDRNRLKGVTYNKARHQNISTAKYE